MDPNLEGALRISRQDVDTVLDSLVRVAELMGKSLGSSHEIVVHDLRKEDASVVYVANGHVTNRKPGQGIRDLLGVMNAQRFHRGALLNYEAPVLKDGKTIRASTLVYFDESDRPVLALCINIDVTALIQAQNLLASLALPEGTQMQRIVPGGGTRDINAVLDNMVREAIEATGRTATTLSTKDKQSVVRALDVRGAFHVRHAHSRVAAALHTSKESVYRYLQQGREDGAT